MFFAVLGHSRDCAEAPMIDDTIDRADPWLWLVVVVVASVLWVRVLHQME
jgi:hypothetical protein